MLKKILKINLICVFLFSLLLLSGCSSTTDSIKNLLGYKTDTADFENMDDAQALALEAEKYMEKDDYKRAARTYGQLKDQYPYSRYALLAELKLGDALYLSAKYIEAQGVYEDFERLHPDNEAVPYAVYQQGMSQYMRMHGIDRDQTPTILTIQTLARLVEMYPNTKYAAMAKARILEAQNNLAGHEFYVGEFYFKRKDYSAAINRFLGLIEYYPDSGYHQQAMNYISKYHEMVAQGKIEADTNLRSHEFSSPFNN